MMGGEVGMGILIGCICVVLVVIAFLLYLVVDELVKVRICLEEIGMLRVDFEVWLERWAKNGRV